MTPGNDTSAMENKFNSLLLTAEGGCIFSFPVSEYIFSVVSPPIILRYFSKERLQSKRFARVLSFLKI